MNEGGRIIVTRKEVADLAGVSEATVSRVFSDSELVRPETREKVLSAAQTLNYYPNAIAQRFARNTSGNIGVILPHVPKVHIFSTYYFSEILSGIGEIVRLAGKDLLLIFRSPFEPMDYTELHLSNKIDASIILGSLDSPDERKMLRKMSELKLPFSLVNQHFEGEAFTEVDADHVHGSCMAVRHLIDQGCSRIAFINGPLAYSNSSERLMGYTKALAGAGFSADPVRMYEGNYSRTSGLRIAERIAEQRHEIDAVFAANDRMALGLMQGLRAHGVRPGIDLPIVGYDDSDASRLTDPPLTSVHVPFYDMGRLAAEAVLRLSAPNAAYVPFRERVKTSLVVRSSSGCG